MDRIPRGVVLDGHLHSIQVESQLSDTLTIALLLKFYRVHSDV